MKSKKYSSKKFKLIRIPVKPSSREKKGYDNGIFRVINILTKLSNGENVTIADLASEFNVTTRTIQRDIWHLSHQSYEETRFPIIFDKQKGSYKFEDGFSLRQIAVTSEEKFLLMLFYRLFSKAGYPFDTAAKNLLDKILVTSDRNDILFNEISAQYKKKVLKEEFTNFSDSLAVRLENCKYPQPFVEKIDAYLFEIKEKIKELNDRNNADIKIEFTNQYENAKPIATISVPKTYFKDNTAKFDFSTRKKEREFTIRTYLPGKFHKSFRISLRLDMFFNFWGVHFKARQIMCFDDFAVYLGFPKESKLFDYDSAHGTHGNKHEFLITHAFLDWQKEIPLSHEEIKPFLNKKSGIPWSQFYDERKKKWVTKR